MRINVYLARATGLSRRAVDGAISDRRIQVNGQPATIGQIIIPDDSVTLDGDIITPPDERTTIMLNKPVGYVCSREGQGSLTVYDLLPQKYHRLKPVGRLDKDSSGLLLLTDDGELANRLTHPRYQKEKVYEVTLDKPLQSKDKVQIEQGVKLDDGISKLQIKNSQDQHFTASLSEGRNRQIRRTFAALGYKVVQLHRIKFGAYALGSLAQNRYVEQ